MRLAASTEEKPRPSDPQKDGKRSKNAQKEERKMEEVAGRYETVDIYFVPSSWQNSVGRQSANGRKEGSRNFKADWTEQVANK